MLEYKVKKILLDNKYTPIRPYKLSHLAALMDISDRHLRNLIKRGRVDDINRIAKGLGVNPAELN